jgi:hypothetical protein
MTMSVLRSRLVVALINVIIHTHKPCAFVRASGDYPVQPKKRMAYHYSGPGPGVAGPSHPSSSLMVHGCPLVRGSPQAPDSWILTETRRKQTKLRHRIKMRGTLAIQFEDVQL